MFVLTFKEAADAISEEYARLRSVADVTEGSAKAWVQLKLIYPQFIWALFKVAGEFIQLRNHLDLANPSSFYCRATVML